MSDTIELKKEVDGNNNARIDNEEISNFLESEENLNRLGEALDSNENSELTKEFWKSIGTLCEKITQQKILFIFRKEADYKKISIEEFNILLFFMEKFGSSPYDNDEEFRDIKEKQQNIGRIVCGWFASYRQRKGEYDQGYATAKDKEEYVKKHYKDLGPFPEYYEKLKQEQRERLEQYINEHPIEPLNLSEEKGKEEEKKWKEETKKIYEILNKTWLLTEKDKDELLKFRNLYNRYRGFGYPSGGSTNIYGNSITEQPFYVYIPSGMEYDQIASKIDEKLRDDEIIKCLIQEIDTIYVKEFSNPIENLKTLGIDSKTQLNWYTLIKSIKTPDDVDKISSDTIGDYITVSSELPKENYDYVVLNVKKIIKTYLQLHPQYKTLIGLTGGSETGLSIGKTWEKCEYEANLLEELNQIESKSLIEQINEIVKQLPNKADLLDLRMKKTIDKDNYETILPQVFDRVKREGESSTKNKFLLACKKNKYLEQFKKSYEIHRLGKLGVKALGSVVAALPDSELLELWLGANLNDKKSNQETVIRQLFDYIPVAKSKIFFKACESNTNLKRLKNNYVLHQLQKNNSIKTGTRVIERKEFVRKDPKDKRAEVNYCFLDRDNKSKFQKFKGQGIILGDNITFDELYDHTRNFYKELEKYNIDSTIPLNQIINFLNSQTIFYEKIRKASSVCEREKDKKVRDYSPGYMPIGGSPSAGHAYLAGEIHASNVKFESEKSKACAELEEEYVKLLLQKKPTPTEDVMGISGAGIELKFSKDPKKGSIEERAKKIVRDSWKEKIGDQRDKFKHDLKNDRQAAFGSLIGMIGGIAGGALSGTLSGGNIYVAAAGFTGGLRLGNGIGQEVWNGGEFLYEQISGNEISDGNNKVESFGQPFLRGVGALDQNYEYVGTSKLISGLTFDYLSNLATFGLGNKFGGFLSKLEGIKFAGTTLKFGMEELILENFLVDIPMNIVQTGFEAFTGIDDGGIIVGNTAIGNQRTVMGETPYKSGSFSDALRAMKDATTQNLSFENLSQTFFNTVLYGGLIEGGGAAVKKIGKYFPAGQVANFEKHSTIAATAFAGLTSFMEAKNIRFNNEGKCIDIVTGIEISENDARFGELSEHLKAIEATKIGYIEAFEAIIDTQKKMIEDPENGTGLLFRLGLISPSNTPLNILKKKKELVEKKLKEARSKGDNSKITQLQKILDIYTDAENKLNDGNILEGIVEQISPLIQKINISVFESVINPQELKQIASKEIENGTLEIGENGEIIDVFIEVNGEKRKSKLFQSLKDGGLSSEQALKSRLQTRTTEFKEWFGDWQNNPETASKIVDENGEPLVMWHGTSRVFSEFRHDAHKNYDWVGNTKDWFYFSNNHKFTQENYANINQQKFKHVAEIIREVTNMEDFEGDNRVTEFESRRNKIIEGFNTGETEWRDTGNNYSDLFYKGKQLYIWESLGILLEGKQNIGKKDFELREMPIKFDTEDGPIEFTIKVYVPKTNYDPLNLPFFIRGDNVSQVDGHMNDLHWMDNSFDQAIKQGDNDTDVIKAYDIETGNQFIGVRDAAQIKSAINNDGSFSPESGKFHDSQVDFRENDEQGENQSRKWAEELNKLEEEILEVENQILTINEDILKLDEGDPRKQELEKDKKALEEKLKKSEKRKADLESAFEVVEQWDSQYNPELLEKQIEEKKEKLNGLDEDSKEYKEIEKDIEDLEKKKNSGIHDVLTNGKLLIENVTLREKLTLRIKKLKCELKKLYYSATQNALKIEEIKKEIKDIERQIHGIDLEISDLINLTYKKLRGLKGLKDAELNELARTYYEKILKPIEFAVIKPSQTFDSGIVDHDFATQRDAIIEGQRENVGKFGNIREKIENIRLGVDKGMNTMSDIANFIDENFEEGSAEKQILLNLQRSLKENVELGDKRLTEADRAVIFFNGVSYMLDYAEAYPDRSAQDLYNVLDINQNKLIHQHVQDKHYLTGSSHDILHILKGNMNMAENFMGKMSAKERVLTRQIIIDHDMGYTSYFNKLLNDIRSNVFFDATYDHPLRGSKFIEDKKEWYVANFGEHEFTIIRDAVTGHSKPDTQNLPTELNTSNEPRIQQIKAVISVVDCVAASADYKSAFLFSQPEIAGEFLSVYTAMNVGDINSAIDGLHKIMETANSIKDPKLKNAIIDALNSFDLVDPETGGITIDNTINDINGMKDSDIDKKEFIKNLRDKKTLLIFCKANGILDLSTVTEGSITLEQIKNYLIFNYLNDRIGSVKYEKYLSQYGVRVSINENGETMIGENGGVVTATFELAGDSFETLLEMGKDNYDFKGKSVADFALASFIKVCDDLNIDLKGEDIGILKQRINDRVENHNDQTISEYLNEKYNGGEIVFTGKGGEKITLKFDGKSYELFNKIVYEIRSIDSELNGAIDVLKNNPGTRQSQIPDIQRSLIELGTRLSEMPGVNVDKASWDRIVEDIVNLQESNGGIEKAVERINSLRKYYRYTMENL